MKKRFIFINQVAGPLFIDIINVFAEKGHDVTLVTGKIEKTYADLDDSIKVCKLISYKRDNILSRLFSWTIFFLQSLFYLILKSGKNKRIIISSNPPVSPFLGFFIKAKFDVLVYDIYPDLLTSSTSIDESSLIYKVFSYLNRKAYQRTENVFTITNGMKSILSKYVNEEKIKVIKCWVDTDFIKPIPDEDNKFLSKYKLSNDFIVMYSGNLGLSHDIESILKAAKKLRNESNIRFVIIGDGPKKEMVEDFISKYSLDNVLSLPLQDRDMLPHSMTACDIALVTLGKGGANYAVPSKTYYFLAAGAVILAVAEKESELADIIQKYKVGDVCLPNNPKEITKSIKKYSENKEITKKAKENSRNSAKQFSPRNAKKFYNHIVR